MNILIIGASGLLGQTLMQFLQDDTIVGTYYQHPRNLDGLRYLDITSASQVEMLMQEVVPEVVIHTAAMTGVDTCEVQKKLARRINVDGSRNLVLAAQQVGARLVYLSTDYVFDGVTGGYTEDDVPCPVNVYGATKLAGEQQVIRGCDDFVIARTSVLFGRSAGNFLTWVLSQLSAGTTCQVVDDQFVTPTLTLDLAEQVQVLLEQKARGVFHTAGGERVSRYEFAVQVAEVFGYDPGLIHPVGMAAMDWSARRPRDSSLDTSKIARVKKPYKLRDALQEALQMLGRRRLV